MIWVHILRPGTLGLLGRVSQIACSVGSNRRRMYMKRVYLLLVTCIVFLYGCSYTVPLTISPAVNIYSSYDKKIKGPVVLVIDHNIRNINQKVKPSTHFCSAHSFSVVVGDTLASSIKATTDAIFDQVVERPTSPTKEEMQEMGMRGTVYVRLNRFYPAIRFSSGYREGYGMASCDIVLDVSVEDSLSKGLLATTVGGTRTADGVVGDFCRQGTNILSSAISQTIRETMERYAERVSNSAKIRKAFRAKKGTGTLDLPRKGL